MVSKKSSGLKQDKNDRKVFAFLGVFLTVIGWLIAYSTKKEDEYVMFYARQGLVIFIVGIIVMIVGMIPIIGWIIGPIASLCLFVVWIIGLVYSLSGERKDIPIIGDMTNKIFE